MSSSTITVLPKEGRAKSPTSRSEENRVTRTRGKSPHPRQVTDSSTSKGTILLRNPLPKYSFQTTLSGGKRTQNSNEQAKEKETNKDAVVAKDSGESENVQSNVPSSRDAPSQSGGVTDEVTISQKDSEVANSQKDRPVNKVGPISNGINTTGAQSHLNQHKSPSFSLNPVPLTPSNVLNVTSSQLCATCSKSNTLNSQSSHLLHSTQSENASPHLHLTHTLSNGESRSRSQSNELLPAGGATVASSNSSPARSPLPVVSLNHSYSMPVLCDCRGRTETLLEENKSLKAQLEVQTQVNTELKKLLVASLGEDLHHRMEKLTRDKAQLSLEVGEATHRLLEDYERMDKISIQADMWRSKYLASRVQVDELASARAYIAMQVQEAQNALQQLLMERHELRANLVEAVRCLQLVKGAFDPLNCHMSPSSQFTNILNLAKTTQMLAEAIKYRLLPNHVASVIAVNMQTEWHDQLTRAEAYAQELLSKRIRPEDFGMSAPSSMAVDRFHQIDRYHPCANDDNLTINVCCKCKGDINVV